MNEKIKSQLQVLRKLPAKQAAEWIIENYSIESSNFGEGILLVGSLSWSKEQQKKLANYYLKKLPFANSKPYELLLSKISLDIFLDAILDNFPKNIKDVDLVKYYLNGLLVEKDSEKEKGLIKSFWDKVALLVPSS